MDQKHLLVLSFNYSESLICVTNVLKHLKQNGYQVHVLCSPQESSETEAEIIQDGIHLHRQTFPVWDLFLRLMEAKKDKTIRFALIRLLRRFIHDVLLRGDKENIFLKKAVYRRAEEIVARCQIEGILSISMPFCNHIVAHQLKRNHPSLGWIIYELDPYTYNYGLPSNELPRRSQREKELLHAADKVIMLDGIEEENERNGFGLEFKDKTVSLPLPNLFIGETPPVEGAPLLDASKINLLFTGSIYGNIRRPEVMLDMMHKMQDPSYHYHIYGWGMEKMVEQRPCPKDRIFLHGQVPRQTVVKAMQEAAVLLNFGNSMTNQTPQKVFDYIATGKPIVNFCYTLQDTSLRYLERYPLFLNILYDEAATDESIRRFKAFCETNRGAFVPKDELRRIYHDILSENVCADMKREIDEGMVPKNRSGANE